MTKKDEFLRLHIQKNQLNQKKRFFKKICFPFFFLRKLKYKYNFFWQQGLNKFKPLTLVGIRFKNSINNYSIEKEKSRTRKEKKKTYKKKRKETNLDSADSIVSTVKEYVKEIITIFQNEIDILNIPESQKIALKVLNCKKYKNPKNCYKSCC